MVTELDQMQSAVASFAASCANKLRGQSAVGNVVTVFVMTNRFREDLQQYYNSGSVGLVTATSDTIEITRAAMEALGQIYRKGIWYKKCGVVISEIQAESPVQLNLFDPIQNRTERAELMKAVDWLNHKYGLKTVKLGIEGADDQAWKVKCEQRTPNYLTDIDELMVVRI